MHTSFTGTQLIFFTSYFLSQIRQVLHPLQPQSLTTSDILVLNYTKTEKKAKYIRCGTNLHIKI